MAKKIKSKDSQDNVQATGIPMMAEIELVPSDNTADDLTGDIPIMPLRNLMVFPSTVVPVGIGREATLKLVNQAYESQSPVIFATQKSSDINAPKLKDLFPLAVVGKVLRVIEMPEGNVTAILQATGPKVEIKEITSSYPFLTGKVTVVEENMADEKSVEFETLMEVCRDLGEEIIGMSDELSPAVALAFKNLKSNEMLANFLAGHLPLPMEAKYKLLKMDTLKERLYGIVSQMNKFVEQTALKQKIEKRTRNSLDRQQREYFLQQEIKSIQEELGNGQDGEIEKLRLKGKKKRWRQEVKEVFENELNKLERVSPQSPDYNVQLTYLQTLIDLPWEVYTQDVIHIPNARKTLDKAHYGLEKVKERILEHLAVLKLRGDLKSPIICLYGPPGVGKTSLGRSIATALKRKYVRMSLGGVHDESEIRGHRKTYIGAMPGRIIKSLIKAGTSNPVIILDEIDKLGNDRHGDPSSAMLEVLDPEQNSLFHDNYVEIDYDLSNIMFIATANDLGSIPPPLLDRMELIEVSGYITEEKIEIARRHLIPKEMEKNGLKKEHVKFDKKAVEYLIENYTRESGVRELEKKISKVMRKIALEIASGEFTKTHELKPEDIEAFLGPQEYSRDKYQGNDYAGVVTGLAWTAVGGEILFVETSLSRGKGQLTLTGNLGSVMKESAMLALEYLKAHDRLLDLPEGVFENWNIHIHVPEGAIPKDGPSAGITMVTSLASALTQRKVKANLAMTGEITLRGKVLPVGGIREKILAAKRAGIKDIILCQENRKDVNEIQSTYLTGLNFHYVKDIKEVLSLALTDEKVADAADLTIKEDNHKDTPAS